MPALHRVFCRFIDTSPAALLTVFVASEGTLLGPDRRFVVGRWLSSVR